MEKERKRGEKLSALHIKWYVAKHSYRKQKLRQSKTQKIPNVTNFPHFLHRLPKIWKVDFLALFSFGCLDPEFSRLYLNLPALGRKKKKSLYGSLEFNNEQWRDDQKLKKNNIQLVSNTSLNFGFFNILTYFGKKQTFKCALNKSTKKRISASPQILPLWKTPFISVEKNLFSKVPVFE